jgi:hypothetical protein
MKAFDAIGDAAREHGSDLGDMPLLVLSAGSAPSTPETIEPFQQMAKELAQLSTAGSWDVIPEADHVGIVAEEDVAGQVAPRITALWQGLR